MSFRIVAAFTSRRLVSAAATLGHGVQRRTLAQAVPALGSESDMKAQAIEQIRARVNYQKELLAAQTHGHDDVDEMWRWLNITFWVALPLSALSCAYSYFFDVHPHRFDGPLPEYMSIRNKEFPWQCGECDLFDGACWKKCRAEKK